ncbi:MAG TPA: response regulator [Thermodesulfobacteriota bacterium]
MSRPRILVVDDERDMRVMLDAVLRRAGFDVEQAADGQAAWEGVLARPPDLVITDILMPRLDGWQLCRRLRAERATARIPIIFLSLRSTAPDRIYGLQLGADDFLPKPFDTRELVARVRAVLKRAAVAAAADEGPDAGITGNLRDMSLVDIAQILDLGRKTAAVRVIGPAGEEVGGLFLERGSMVHAVHAGVAGRAALPSLLALSEGRFEIVLGGEAPARTLSGSTQELLLDALRAADELGRPPAADRAEPAGAPGAPRAGEPAGAPGAPRAGKVPAAAPSAERTSPRTPAAPPSTPSAIQPTLLDLFALGVIEPKG